MHGLAYKFPKFPNGNTLWLPFWKGATPSRTYPSMDFGCARGRFVPNVEHKSAPMVITFLTLTNIYLFINMNSYTKYTIKWKKNNNNNNNNNNKWCSTLALSLSGKQPCLMPTKCGMMDVERHVTDVSKSLGSVRALYTDSFEQIDRTAVQLRFTTHPLRHCALQTQIAS